MLQSKFLSVSAIGFVLSLGPAVWADTPASARPGTINYVEGQVGLGAKSLGSSDMGKTELAPGQVLQTGSGKAEILLTPGTFLRLGSNSAVRMVSPGLTDTRVAVLNGRAMVESTALSKNSNVQVAENGSSTRLLKDGIYEFDADRSNVKVFDGKADVYQNDAKVELKKGREVQVGEAAPLKAEKFDRKAAEDDLYKWSSARSEYLARANEATVHAYVVNPGFGYSSGWYWNPWFRTWSFMPYDGLFYSPFGYGFYSPRYYYHPRPVIIVPRTRVIVPQNRIVVPRATMPSSGMTTRGMMTRGMRGR